MNVLFLVGYAILLFVLVTFFIAGRSLAPWVPMYRKDLPRILKAACLQEGEKFVEIGSGDGRVAHYMATQCPGNTVLGIEKYYPIYLVSRLRLLFFPRSNLQLVCGDALSMNFSDVDVVYTYALKDSLNEKLVPKLLRELKPGARIVSYIFQIEPWPGTVVADKPDPKDTGVYTYVVS